MFGESEPILNPPLPQPGLQRLRARNLTDEQHQSKREDGERIFRELTKTVKFGISSGRCQQTSGLADK
jgi:hypothetical protein